ncbi:MULTISPECIES: flagellar protein FlgN [unclassified Sphingosinithalassobacter]|uniref:flagellar protein FlgN n=1 Tax=unclassified Sphingosinithalassobacter TaxID=2676235 RepID=UPI00165E375B|nr:flagellar protein FlgN [Sphingosinithalassobacter sp. CS137]
MTRELHDAIVSMTALMEEESEQLARSARVPELPEIASAKLRLAGKIENEVARLGRETPDWIETLDDELRAELADASQALRDASLVNAQVLKRQIELSVEMMEAIAAEAKRLTGTRNATYGARGALGGIDAPAPISINTRL